MFDNLESTFLKKHSEVVKPADRMTVHSINVHYTFRGLLNWNFIQTVEKKTVTLTCCYAECYHEQNWPLAHFACKQGLQVTLKALNYNLTGCQVLRYLDRFFILFSFLNWSCYSKKYVYLFEEHIPNTMPKTYRLMKTLAFNKQILIISCTCEQRFSF